MTMKKYRETIAAGGMLEIEHPASFFSLLKAVSPVDVEFLKDYRIADKAEQMVAGLWFEPATEFDRVRIWNPEAYDVTVEFLVSFGRSGWSLPSPSCQTIRTDLDGLAASAGATSTVTDLGDDWAACVLTLQAELTASAGGSMSLWCSDAVTMFERRMCVGQGYQGVAFTNTSTSNHHMSSLRPTGRFLQAQFNNGATAQAAGKRMILSIMRNVTA